MVVDDLDVLKLFGPSGFRIEASAAAILIAPLLHDSRSWYEWWIGSRAGEDSKQGGGR